VTSNSTSVCTVRSGLTVSYVGVGTCSLTAHVAAGTNYGAADGSAQSFLVGKRAQTITFTSTAPTGAKVGGATYSVTATGGASGNAVTFTSGKVNVCTVSLAVVSFIRPGTCIIDAHQAGIGNYAAAPRVTQAFVVSKGSQSITFTSIPPSNATVGGPTYTVTATGGASGNAVTVTSATSRVCTIAGRVVSFIKSGTCTINAGQAGNSDYTAAPRVTQTFTVHAATITSTELSPAIVNPIRDSATAYDPATGQTLLFGGNGLVNDQPLGDTWTWNGNTWTELSPTTSPTARCSAAMAYDPATGQTLLFGGIDSNGYLDDTWTWNGATWTERHPAMSPPARGSATMAYDPATAQMLLFGGSNGSAVFGDTWTWNGTTWAESALVTSPPGRDSASMVYEPGSAQIVLSGGVSSTTSTPNSLGDTWTWNGATWTEVSMTARPPAL
jgi:hypothetical protein